MRLKDRVPVEPLDDIQLTNIERRVVLAASELGGSRPLRAPARFGWALGAAAVTAVVAGGAGWMLHARTARSTVAHLTATGTGAAGTTTAGTTSPVAITTDATGSTLDIGDAVIASDPDTAFAVTRPDGKVLIAMTRGRVELEVAKRGQRPPLIVHAGDTDVIVVGTHFSVDYGDGTGGVDVHVTEGVVRVERARQVVRVMAGSAWTASRGVVTMVELPERPGAVHVAARGGSGAGAGSDAGSGDALATIGSGAYEIDMGTVPDVLKNRVAAVPDPHAPVVHRPHRVEPAEGASGSSDARPGSTTGAAPRPKSLEDPADPHADLEALVRKQTVVPALDVGTVSGEQAMAAYRATVTTEKGKAAALALYSMAVTQHLKLGRNADALATIDAYLRRFNTSDYHDAVLWLRVRIRCLSAIDDRCRAAAEQYERHAPSGPAASVAELITLTSD